MRAERPSRGPKGPQRHKDFALGARQNPILFCGGGKKSHAPHRGGGPVVAPPSTPQGERKRDKKPRGGTTRDRKGESRSKFRVGRGLTSCYGRAEGKDEILVAGKRIRRDGGGEQARSQWKNKHRAQSGVRKAIEVLSSKKKKGSWNTDRRPGPPVGQSFRGPAGKFPQPRPTPQGGNGAVKNRGSPWSVPEFRREEREIKMLYFDEQDSGPWVERK